MSSAPRLADCHLHFEGSLPAETVEALARRSGHRFERREALDEARRAVADPADFLSLYAEICKLFKGPDDYAEAAGALVRQLSADGVAYAEVYVSPEIFGRLSLDRRACLEAIDAGFREQGRAQGITCRILLDAVRHWGPESADRVLGLFEASPYSSIVGFGIGGDEKALPASAFEKVYDPARSLGLKTSVHAGEWSGPESVREALDVLLPDRIDHGIAAVKDRDLVERLADAGTVLWVAPSGNVFTGAVPRLEDHPLKELLEAGVRVALGADDPLLFDTTTSREYAAVREALHLDDDKLALLYEDSWRGAFCTTEERLAGLERLGIKSLD
jgi:adenosine deaminase